MLPMLSNRFEPFGSSAFLPDLRREIDRLFEDAWTGSTGFRAGSWVPPVEVTESDDDIRCTLELPGLAPEDISITVENNVLTIEGEKKLERDDSRNGTVRRGEYRIVERRYGHFSRSFALPRQVDADNVAARYEHGVLTVVLPKSAEAKPRRIPVHGGDGAAQKQIAGTSRTGDRHAA